MKQPNEPINAFELLAVLLDQVAEVAWQKIGLRPDALTGRIAPDLPQAKALIDVAGSIAETIRPQLDPEDQRQIDNLVRDLRVNYLQRTS